MKINTIELIISAVRESQYPTDQKKEFLLVGRSNVGKSSFINSIINRNNYAWTSATPVKPQTLNFYKKAGYNSEDKTAFIQWLSGDMLCK